MHKFSEMRWNQPEHNKTFCEEADHYIQERKILVQILGSFYKNHVQPYGGKRILDLGCGDVILGELLKNIDRDIELVCVDVECHYKYGLFAVYGGRISSSSQ